MANDRTIKQVITVLLSDIKTQVQKPVSFILLQSMVHIFFFSLQFVTNTQGSIKLWSSTLDECKRLPCEF